jgi:hypothetical protein
MKKLIATVALLLMVPAWGSAQDTDHQPHGLGYVFLGLGTQGMGFTSGFGGEGYLSKGLGLGAEVGAAGLGASNNRNPNIIGVGSVDLSYHFFPKKIHGKPVPFVEGGYTIFFGQDVELLSPGCPLFGCGHYQNGFNIGGGIDIFGTKHAGVRFDVRYNGHGGRILWASYPNLAQLSFVAFRIGLTFR